MVTTNGNILEVGPSQNAWKAARSQRVRTAEKRGVVKNVKFTRGQVSSRKLHDGFTRRLNLMTKYQRYMAQKKRHAEQDRARLAMLKTQRESARNSGIPFAGDTGVLGWVKALVSRIRTKLGV